MALKSYIEIIICFKHLLFAYMATKVTPISCSRSSPPKKPRQLTPTPISCFPSSISLGAVSHIHYLTRTNIHFIHFPPYIILYINQEPALSSLLTLNCRTHDLKVMKCQMIECQAREIKFCEGNTYHQFQTEFTKYIRYKQSTGGREFKLKQ